MADADRQAGDMMAELKFGPQPSIKRDENEQMIDSLIEQHAARGTVASADLPPSQTKTVDQVLEDMSKVPLFMNSMDDVVNADDNPQLEALRALAYEGTRAEVAENFKSQGNELTAVKKWKDAKEFYNKAIVALESPQQNPHSSGEAVELDENAPKVVELDEEAEALKEQQLLEACYANRALCHLELKNYGSCIRDCATVLRTNPRHVKAFYRAACACLAVDKLLEALDAAEKGLAVDPKNGPLATIRDKIVQRQHALAVIDQQRAKREGDARLKKLHMKKALALRGFHLRASLNPPDMEDAELTLDDVNDPTSSLSMPLLLLYPLEAQSDLIKAVSEHDNLLSHLAYIMPPPWDAAAGEYASPSAVECYMETASGGLIKAGKNLSMLKLLSGGKVELVDGLVRVNVVPKAKTTQYIDEFKKRRTGTS